MVAANDNYWKLTTSSEMNNNLNKINNDITEFVITTFQPLYNILEDPKYTKLKPFFKYILQITKKAEKELITTFQLLIKNIK